MYVYPTLAPSLPDIPGLVFSKQPVDENSSWTVATDILAFAMAAFATSAFVTTVFAMTAFLMTAPVTTVANALVPHAHTHQHTPACRCVMVAVGMVMQNAKCPK